MLDLMGAMRSEKRYRVLDFGTDAINVPADSTTGLKAATGANQEIWVMSWDGITNVAGTVLFQDEDDTALTGVYSFSANAGAALSAGSMPRIMVPANKGLEIVTATCTFDGSFQWVVVEEQ